MASRAFGTALECAEPAVASKEVVHASHFLRVAPTEIVCSSLMVRRHTETHSGRVNHESLEFPERSVNDSAWIPVPFSVPVQVATQNTLSIATVP